MSSQPGQMVRYSIGVPHKELLNGIENIDDPADRIQFMYTAMRRIVRSPTCTCVYCTHVEEDNPLLVFDEEYNTSKQETRKPMTIQEVTKHGELDFEVVPKSAFTGQNDVPALKPWAIPDNHSSKRKTDLSGEGQHALLAEYREQARLKGNMDKSKVRKPYTRKSPTKKSKHVTTSLVTDEIPGRSPACSDCQKSKKKCYHQMPAAHKTALENIEKYKSSKGLLPVQAPATQAPGTALKNLQGNSSPLSSQGKESALPPKLPAIRTQLQMPVKQPSSPAPQSQANPAQPVASPIRHHGFLYPSFDSKALSVDVLSGQTSPRTFLWQAQAVADGRHASQTPTPASTPPPPSQVSKPNSIALPQGFPGVPRYPTVPVKDNLWVDADNVKWMKNWLGAWEKYRGT